jgi:hypothetical protein
MRFAVLLSIAITHCATVWPQSPADSYAGEIPDLKSFLPEEATLTKQMTVDFTNGREPVSIVIAYQGRDEEGLRILRPDKAKAWKVVYQEANPAEPGPDELTLHPVRAANGIEGLVVVYYHSGAGTTTDWKIIAESNSKFVTRDAAPIRDRIPKRRRLIFGGYNGVRVDHDLVIETIPGYSPGMARCCPDKPSIELRVKFTGTSIKLDTVGQQKTSPAK